MITITVNPPKGSDFSKNFLTVSDAYDFLETLHVYGYAGARKASLEVLIEPCKVCGRVDKIIC